MFPSSATFYSAIVLSLVFIAGAIYILVRKPKKQEEPFAEEEVAAGSEQEQVQAQPYQNGTYRQAVGINQAYGQMAQPQGQQYTAQPYQQPTPPIQPQHARKPAPQPEVEEELPVFQEQPAQVSQRPSPQQPDVAMETSLLTESDDTVLLMDEEGEELPASKHKPFWRWSETAKRKRFRLMTVILSSAGMRHPLIIQKKVPVYLGFILNLLKLKTVTE